jgi:exosortase
MSRVDPKSGAVGHKSVSPISNSAVRSSLIFAGWLTVCCALFWRPVHELVRYALSTESASHILLIPLITAWLIYQDRQKLSQPVLDFGAASLFAVPALALAAFFYLRPPQEFVSALAGWTISFLLLVISGFVAVFGPACSKSVWFALAFLAFFVPIPDVLLNPFIHFLQSGSAYIAEALFELSGIPVLRDGFFFYLPKISIEIAKECSGIRSSMALLILALLVAHFSFRPFWKKLVFVAAGLLLMIVKNGVRIATLALLANYVNPQFLYGRLHREGGAVFFLLGLGLLLPIYVFLRRGETAESDAPQVSALVNL